MEGMHKHSSIGMQNHLIKHTGGNEESLKSQRLLSFPTVMSKYLEKHSWTLMLGSTLMWSENTTNKVGCAL